MIVVIMSIMLLIPETAGAAQAERLHGLVLSVTPKTGQVVVRHDAFAGMPGMTMPFRVLPRERAAELQAGAVIDAVVDRSTEPWTLRDVATKTAQPLTTEPLFRRVKALRTGDLVPATPFRDQRDRAFDFAQLRGADVVLAFVYTRCQDARMCPLISAKFHQLQGMMGTRKLHLVEVTLDPAYDRPAVLARYGKTFGANPEKWTLAVGDANATLDFAAQFGITGFPDPNIGIIHAENTVLIGTDGRIREMITENSWTPDELLAQIDAQNGLSANPIKRFDLWLSRQAVALCGNAVAGFSGLTDLIVVLALFGAVAYLAVRIARGIFAKQA